MAWQYANHQFNKSIATHGMLSNL